MAAPCSGAQDEVFTCNCWRDTKLMLSLPPLAEWCDIVLLVGLLWRKLKCCCQWIMAWLILTTSGVLVVATDPWNTSLIRFMLLLVIWLLKSFCLIDSKAWVIHFQSEVHIAVSLLTDFVVIEFTRVCVCVCIIITNIQLFFGLSYFLWHGHFLMCVCWD